MVLLLASQALAGGIVCAVDAIGSSGDEMACCLQGTSPTGSVLAMVCCEVKCGKSTGGSQLEFAQQTFVLAPSVVTIRYVSLDVIGEVESAGVSVRSAERNLLHHDPPDLFLSNSTFLI
jgi:hypothetical protein